MTFFAELKRRNVFRIGVAYVLFAWVLLQGADFGLDLVGAPNWIIQALSVVAAAGLPAALVIAWAFELTPEGLKREKDVDRSQSITAQTGRKLDRVIIGVLTVTVAYLLLDKFVLQDVTSVRDAAPNAASGAARVADPANGATPPAEMGPSVAVLPFVNMSGDRDNEYFSDGLTETLLHMLSQLPGLRVAARTSSFAFKGQSVSISEIAGTLGVANVLEGSVQKANDRVRITAQLIRADDGFHIWSQNYTRPLEDIFAIQDEIATDVAEALGSSLLGTSRPDLHGVNTSDLSAYDSYLKGLEQQAIYSYGSLGVAENHFKQAMARDPGFTDARLALARNYLFKYSTGLINDQEVRALIEPLIRQVREQEPDNPLARALELSLNLIIFNPAESATQIRAMVDELQDLLQVLPTQLFIRVNVAATLFQFFGNGQEAIAVLQAGLLIDPLEAELYRWLGRIYAQNHQLEEARASLQRSLELAPENPNNYSTMADLEFEADNLPAALDWIRRATLVDNQDHELVANIARNLYRLRLAEEGDYWLARAQALAPDSALTRSLEVERAAARDEPQQVIALASALIADQVEDRQGAFGGTMNLYMDAMLEAGRAREAYDFLVSVRPEISHYDQVAPGVQGLIMQWASIVAMSGFESFENRQAAWKQFTGGLDAVGLPWKRDPADGNYTWDYLMNGEVDKAIDHYLEYEINEPLAMNLDRHRKPHYAVFGPVYEDPRVAAKLNEEAERYAQVREEVRAMLQRPEWNNP
jgi:TolB-like protein/Flp pilus assembly protein TadD